MTLLISGIVIGEARVRRLLDRLGAVGFHGHDIIVVHPGEAAPAPREEARPLDGDGMAAVGGGVSAAAAGMFGWLVGYGVLAIPAAAMAAAIGGGIGKAAGDGLPTTLLERYAEQISGDQVLVAVRTQEARGYDIIQRIYRDERVADILTSGKGRLQGPREATA
jgi:hypothetical protein